MLHFLPVVKLMIAHPAFVVVCLIVPVRELWCFCVLNGLLFCSKLCPFRNHETMHGRKIGWYEVAITGNFYCATKWNGRLSRTTYAAGAQMSFIAEKTKHGKSNPHQKNNAQ